MAPLEEIDRICRHGGRASGWARSSSWTWSVSTSAWMWPRSFFEQSFGEPRWRPSPIPVKLVASGAAGRKSGRGYYDYSRLTPIARRIRSLLPWSGGDGLIVLAGSTPLADQLRVEAA